MDQHAEIELWLKRRVGGLVGNDPAQIDVSQPFSEIGLTSQSAVELSIEIEDWLGREVPSTLLWDHPDIASLTGWLLRGDPAAGPAHGGGEEAVKLAIIGIGCRFPGGVTGPEEFWKLLAQGRNAVGEMPAGRWRGPKSRLPFAGVLDDVQGFDCDFFGISPREASAMDIRQRVLLEVSWEALENAGLAADALRGSSTGVFIGASANERAPGFAGADNGADPYALTGSALSIAANRLSYFYDLRGPSITVDTACSSSLVAVHLASQSIRSGECDIALCGAVNLLLSAGVTMSLDRAGAMAADGRCKAFAASADGYVRGEGCGVVVLKPLDSALRDGDRVLAVIRGSVISQDGRSNGLMAPRMESQVAMLRRAYSVSGVRPSQVDYVEAHGTGTLLGDPIEAKALGAVLGVDRAKGSPLWLGSVKTNIGHLEAAAGIAGLIKTTLALSRRFIPASLHFDRPNPHIPFRQLGLRVAGTGLDWPGTGCRLAGVSSFGFGGTNAHVVLEQAPDLPDLPSAPAGSPHRLMVGGASRQRTAEAATRLADWLEDRPGIELPDVSHSLARRRPGPARAVVVAQDMAQALAGLRAAAAGGSHALVHQGTRQRNGTVWLFSGHGSQRPGMGRELLASEPAFEAAVGELAPGFLAETGFSLPDALSSGDSGDDIDIVQPLLFAMQVALARLWQAHGAEPAAVIGHSVGEVAAAVVAGALPVSDGLRVVARRSRLMKRLAGQGKMLALGVPVGEALTLAEPFADVEIAVLAAPSQTVLAGPASQIDRLASLAGARDIPHRLVAVDVASHSAQISPLLDDLESVLSGISGSMPRVPFYSTVLDPPATPAFDARYWCENLRRPVRFAPAVDAAIAAGYSVFTEISPHPVLLPAVAEAADDLVLIPTLRRNAGERMTFHAALAAMQAAHLADPPTSGRLLDLPTTSWQHVQYPVNPPHATGGRVLAVGTLLGARRTICTQPTCELWEGVLTPGRPVFPGRHAIAGSPTMPASVLLNTLLRAADEAGQDGVAEVGLLQPMFTDQPQEIQVALQDGRLTLAARGEDGTWRTHLTARLGGGPSPDVPVPHAAAGTRLDPGEMAGRASALGYEGQAFPWTVGEVTRHDTYLAAEVEIPGDAPGTACLLDAALQLAPYAATEQAAYVPSRVGAAAAVSPACAAGRYRVLACRREVGGDGVGFDIAVEAEEGARVLTMTDVRYRRLSIPTGPNVYRLAWAPEEPTQTGPLPTVAVIGTGDIAQAVAAAFGEAGTQVMTAGPDAFPAADAVVLVAPGSWDDPVLPAAARAGCLALSQAVGTLSKQRAGRLWVVTRGVRTGDARGLTQAPLWGLAQAISAEFPESWGGIVDLDPDDPAGTSAAGVVAAVREDARGLTAYSGGARLAARLTAMVEAPGTPFTCERDGTYLITGGLGELGLHMARFMTDRGARRLLLVGRTPMPERAAWTSVTDPASRRRVEAVRELERAGVTVVTAAADVSDEAALRAAIGDLAAIRGVVHAAGNAVDRTVTDLDEHAFAEALSGKLAGAWLLNKLFPPGTLDFMIFFSSAGALIGVPGQGAYAAANSFLDALARRRADAGCRSVSIGWGPWQSAGMSARGGGAVVGELVRRVGMRALPPDEALAAIDRIHGGGVAHVLVTGGRPPDLRPRPLRDPGRWPNMSAGQRRTELISQIHLAIFEETGIAPQSIDNDLPLADRGLDSISAVGICRRLAEGTGLRVSATLLWRFPTVNAIATFLDTQLAPATTVTSLRQPVANPLAALLDELARPGEGTR